MVDKPENGRRSRSIQERPEAPPLPEEIKDWARKIKAERSFNDLIEDHHRALVDTSAEYRKLLRATYDAHAVEGSLSADNTMAAQMIRKRAVDTGDTEVAEEKLAIISMALGVVLRRYGASRKERRLTVGGVIQPPTDNND